MENPGSFNDEEDLDTIKKQKPNLKIDRLNRDVLEKYLKSFGSEPIDKDKLKRAIVIGSVLTSLYFFESLSGDEWYEKDANGKFIIRHKDLIEEIFG
jgi:hypothetical protein